ncbi:MAG: hypothetical protein F6K16_04480 [Symploca sp. SIO2B6]|nr:hypothetical protein [Symploca sp. SIO2B6]
MNLQLYAPQVHLFAFHLFRTLDSVPGSGVKNPDLLWEQCRGIFEKFHIKEQLELKSPHPEDCRYDLIKGKQPNDILLDIKPIITFDQKDLILAGFVLPIQFYDSYGFGLTIGYPDVQPENLSRIPVADISILEEFNPDYCLLPEEIGSNLGQTLIITAWLSDEQKQAGEQFWRKLADQCIKEFIPKGKRPSFSRQGQLFNSPIFEYENINYTKKHYHILVCFWNDYASFKKFEDFYYEPIIELLYYRNKIIAEFRNSRYTYKYTRNEYQVIERLTTQTIKELSPEDTLTDQDLQQLKPQLKKLIVQSVEYSNLLQDLGFRKNSIIIHTANYQTKLQTLRNELQAESESEPDLSFLETFAQKNCLTFQEQIQADFGYFVQGSSLLEKAINSIRGIVAIDQAERDRKREDREKESDRQLQVTIFAASAGVTVGGIVASSSGQITEQNPIKWNVIKFHDHPIHPFTVLVFFSIVAGLVAGGIAWWLTKQWHKCRH